MKPKVGEIWLVKVKKLTFKGYALVRIINWAYLCFIDCENKPYNDEYPTVWDLESDEIKLWHTNSPQFKFIKRIQA